MKSFANCYQENNRESHRGKVVTGESSSKLILAASEHFMLSKAKQFWMRKRHAHLHCNVVQFYGEKLIIPSNFGPAPPEVLCI